MRDRFCAMVLLAGLLTGCQSREASAWVSHPLGGLTLKLPATFQTATAPGDTLVATPPDAPGVTLRFNVNALDAPGVPADIGVQFVRSMAKKKKLPVEEKGGKAILTESSVGEENGVKVETRFWQIGVQKAVVVMSATVVLSKKNDPAVKECLDTTVPQIIESIRK